MNGKMYYNKEKNEDYRNLEAYMREYYEELKEALKRLPQYIKLLYKIFDNRQLKRSHRLMLYGAIGYVISPIDLIPGVIPVLGQIDDIIVVISVLYKILSSYKKDKFESILAECDLTIETVQDDMTTMKYYAKLYGISATKLTAYGLKAIGKKGLKAIEEFLYDYKDR